MPISQTFSGPRGLSRLTLAMLVLGGAGGLFSAEPTAARKKPNVLFVISDDLSSRIQPTGYEGVMTPVLDRLAKDATTFQRAYCQYPVCGPSRASFLSGLYPQTTGVLDNTVKIADTLPSATSMPKVFRQAGYWTASVGKVFHRF
jgi:iduronate 2-sulfatase